MPPKIARHKGKPPSRKELAQVCVTTAVLTKAVRETNGGSRVFSRVPGLRKKAGAILRRGPALLVQCLSAPLNPVTFIPGSCRPLNWLIVHKPPLGLHC
jgi:hypothetical protein